MHSFKMQRHSVNCHFLIGHRLIIHTIRMAEKEEQQICKQKCQLFSFNEMQNMWNSFHNAQNEKQKKIHTNIVIDV